MSADKDINNDEININFLCKRLKQLRIDNGDSMDKFAKKLNISNRSSISRIEAGKMGKKTVLEYMNLCFEKLKLDDTQKENLLRSEKIAVPDMSILLNNPRFADELSEGYNKVVISDFIIDELNRLYSRDSKLSKKAWQILRSINSVENIVCLKYEGKDDNEQEMMMFFAEQVLGKYGCEIHLYTYELKGTAYVKRKMYDEKKIKVYDSSDYAASTQNLSNMNQLNEIDKYYGDDYNEIQITPDLANAYLTDGKTLITSAILSGKPTEQVKKKIKWLVDNGADVNKRENRNNFFPALTIAIQINKFELFKYLLKDLKANPNVGSKNPSGKGNFLTSNDGNMPLMVAAHHGRKEFVKLLCEHPDISINQQDANGFTALIKASRNGFFDCRSILLDAGADEKIVDRNGRTAQDWLDNFNVNGSSLKNNKK